MTFANFKSSGNVPDVKHSLIISVKGSHIYSAIILSIYGGIPSIPQEYLVGKLVITLNTSLHVTGCKKIEFLLSPIDW